MSLASSFFLNKYKKKHRTDYVIPKPKQQSLPQVPERKQEKSEKFVLDQNKLAELKAQTREAQDLLAGIFIPDEEEVKPIVAKSDSTLLERLFAKDVWKRDEVLGMLEPGEMLGSVLEKLNDYAYEKVGDVVVEDDGDSIYVMTEYKEQLI